MAVSRATVLLLCLLSTAMAQEGRKRMREDMPEDAKRSFKETLQLFKKCAKESSITRETLKIFKERTSEIPESEELKKFVACMLKGKGVVNDQGDVNQEKCEEEVTMISRRHQDKMGDMKKCCEDAEGDGLEGRSFGLLWCLKDVLGDEPFFRGFKGRGRGRHQSGGEEE